MLKKDQVIDKVTIIDYTHEGLGVGKEQGIPIFIKYAKLKQQYQVKIIKVEKKVCVWNDC